MHAKSLSCVWLFCNPMEPARLLCSWDFLHKNTEVGSYSSAGEFPNWGIKSTSPVSPTLAGRFLTTELPGTPVGIVADAYGLLYLKQPAYIAAAI